MWSSDANEELIHITYDEQHNLLISIPNSIQFSHNRIQSDIIGMRMVVQEEKAPEVTMPLQPRLTTVNNTTTSVIANAF